MHRIASWLCVLLLTALPVRSEELSAVKDVEWPSLRDHCSELLDALGKAKAPLPGETVDALRAQLDRQPADTDAASAAVQKWLVRHCLVAVHINPESRVKTASGPAVRELILNQPTVVLVRIHNEGGVTSTLRVGGPGIIATQGDGSWLEMTPLTRTQLSGRRLEYVAFRLTPHEAGKREATFRFDVGQGTQDLGFRAEVPILFTVRKR